MKPATRIGVMFSAGACWVLVLSVPVAAQGNRPIFSGSAPWIAFTIAIGGLSFIIAVVAAAGRGVGPPPRLTAEETPNAHDAHDAHGGKSAPEEPEHDPEPTSEGAEPQEPEPKEP